MSRHILIIYVLSSRDCASLKISYGWRHPWKIAIYYHEISPESTVQHETPYHRLWYILWHTFMTQIRFMTHLHQLYDTRLWHIAVLRLIFTRLWHCIFTTNFYDTVYDTLWCHKISSSSIGLRNNHKACEINGLGFMWYQKLKSMYYTMPPNRVFVTCSTLHGYRYDYLYNFNLYVPVAYYDRLLCSLAWGSFRLCILPYAKDMTRWEDNRHAAFNHDIVVHHLP